MLNPLKKAATALCACVMFFTGCSGTVISDVPSVPQGETPVTSETAPVSSGQTTERRTSLRLAYDANDTLNPYTAVSLRNRQLLPLLYDSLVETDERFQPQMQIAESVTVTDTVCLLRWRRDAQFSDGTFVTGRDILYSLTTAQNSQTQWSIMLQNLASVSVVEEGTALELRLHRPDADFAAMLTCPVVKEGTANEDFPVTVGKYYVEGAHNTGLHLAFNKLYFEDGGRFDKITLYHAADMEALQFRLKAGEIDLGYSGTADSVASGLSVGQRPLKTSNLVYLGVNGQNTLLSQPEFRQALSLALGRDAIVKEAYSRKADAAAYPFHPDYYKFGDDSPRVQPNLTQAEALLDALKLEKNEEGKRLWQGAPITLRLLVNTENAARLTAASLAARQLSQLGITVETVTGSFSQYTGFLQSGGYDLYLGEVRLTESFDVRLLLNGGNLAYFTPYTETLSAAYEAYRETGEGLTEMCEQFTAYSPFIPLVFPWHDVYVSHDLEANPMSTQQNVFYHILAW